MDNQLSHHGILSRLHLATSIASIRGRPREIPVLQEDHQVLLQVPNMWIQICYESAQGEVSEESLRETMQTCTVQGQGEIVSQEESRY